VTRSTLKSRLRKQLARPPFRYVAEPLFDGLVRAELEAFQRWSPPAAELALSAQELGRVTAIIKTFERPRLLARLVGSLQRCFPQLPIIVADDSRVPTRLAGVRTIELPFDSGVSAGRQAALAAVATELTWVLDDDFITLRSTALAAAVRGLEQHPELDLVGGNVIDLPLLSGRGSLHDPLYPTTARPRVSLGTRFGDIVVCDKVPNFFVARTQQLRQVGWDARLRRVEHGDFFTRARGVLVTGYLAKFWCLHAQAPFDSAYMSRREDYAADEVLLRARYFP
jgi:hypothetical protein